MPSYKLCWKNMCKQLRRKQINAIQTRIKHGSQENVAWYSIETFFRRSTADASNKTYNFHHMLQRTSFPHRRKVKVIVNLKIRAVYVSYKGGTFRHSLHITKATQTYKGSNQHQRRASIITSTRSMNAPSQILFEKLQASASQGRGQFLNRPEKWHRSIVMKTCSPKVV